MAVRWHDEFRYTDELERTDVFRDARARRKRIHLIFLRFVQRIIVFAIVASHRRLRENSEQRECCDERDDE